MKILSYVSSDADLTTYNSGKKHPMYGVHRFGEASPHFGKKHSIESKAQMSISAKNRPPASEKTKQQMSKNNSGTGNPFFGKKHPPKLQQQIATNTSFTKHLRTHFKDEAELTNYQKQNKIKCKWCNGLSLEDALNKI